MRADWRSTGSSQVKSQPVPGLRKSRRRIPPAPGLVQILDAQQKTLAGARRGQRGKGVAQMQIPCRRWREACNDHRGNLDIFLRHGFALPVRALPPAKGKPRVWWCWCMAMAPTAMT